MQAVGTTAVESIDKQINALIRFMGSYHIETLVLKLTMYQWLHVKAHNSALYRSTVRLKRFDEVAAAVGGTFRITDSQWHTFCSSEPSVVLSKQQAIASAALRARRESNVTVKEKFKRTPFTLIRQ